LADPKHFLPLSVRYSVIADGRRSCRSARPHTFFSARVTNYACLHTKVSLSYINRTTLAEVSSGFVVDSWALLLKITVQTCHSCKTVSVSVSTKLE